jgi:hypothetical protein
MPSVYKLPKCCDIPLAGVGCAGRRDFKAARRAHAPSSAGRAVMAMAARRRNALRRDPAMVVAFTHSASRRGTRSSHARPAGPIQGSSASSPTARADKDRWVGRRGGGISLPPPGCRSPLQRSAPPRDRTAAAVAEVDGWHCPARRAVERGALLNAGMINPFPTGEGRVQQPPCPVRRPGRQAEGRCAARVPGRPRHTR